MTEQSQSPPESSDPTKEAFADLSKKKHALATKAAAIQSQLRAIDRSLDTLGQNARDETIHLQLTKGDAGLLMGICVQYAVHISGPDTESGKYIDGLGQYIFKAMYEQNADFAQRIRIHYGNHATGSIAPQEQASESARSNLPKRYRPYLRHTDEQVKVAWGKSALACKRNYYGCGYVRLYLTRTALVEMYRQSRNLRIVYADMLKAADTHQNEHSVSRLCPCGFYDPIELQNTDRFKPYEQYSEQEKKSAIRKLGISLAQVKIAYGFFAVTLLRDTIWKFYKKSPYVKPAVACLLKKHDELRTEG